MKYSVKLIIRHTVETGEVFIEESIIMTEAGSFEEAYSKAREYVKENEISAAYKNTFGRQVKSEVVSFADCFSVYDDEEVIEVYSSIIKTRGELPADTVVSVLEESCTREDLLPLRQWPCGGLSEEPAAEEPGCDEDGAGNDTRAIHERRQHGHNPNLLRFHCRSIR